MLFSHMLNNHKNHKNGCIIYKSTKSTLVWWQFVFNPSCCYFFSAIKNITIARSDLNSLLLWNNIISHSRVAATSKTPSRRSRWRSAEPSPTRKLKSFLYGIQRGGFVDRYAKAPEKFRLHHLNNKVIETLANCRVGRILYAHGQNWAAPNKQKCSVKTW